MKKICIITTLWSSINNWIKPMLNEYNKQDIDVTIVCNMDKKFEEELINEYPFVHTHQVAFPRGIDFIKSIKSIIHLFFFFKKEKFDLVQYSTPNASMYAAVASKFAKVPVRLYCQWGMVYVTMSGLKQKIFKFIERLVCRFSTNIQPDSKGNLDFCRENGLYSKDKSCVIWNGSAKGIDLAAFDITKKDEYSATIKHKYNIPNDTPVIGFVGRLGKEKGCNELFLAFKALKEKYPKLKLLFVGPIEKEETIEPSLLKYFYDTDDIIKTGRVKNVEQYTSAMDVFVLPSYREGFGMSVIEASAMGVPVVVTKYPGPSSAIEEGVTGYSVDVYDVDNLVLYIDKLLSNPALAKELGQNGRKFVADNFEQKKFIEKYIKNRLELLKINK